jgi:signal transduction histidine kinase
MIRWPHGKGSLGIYALLIGSVVALCFWQQAEHARFEQAATQSLVNRGRDITSTLGVVVRSLRRFGGIVSKDRIEAALQDLVRPGELESLAILGATGETIAAAGPAIEITPDMLRGRGSMTRDNTLLLLNLMDLGGASEDQSAQSTAAIVVTDPRAFRQNPAARRPAAESAKGEPAVAPTTPPAPTTPARAPFGRPSWMSREDYDAIIQKQGVHSLVIAFSLDDTRRAVRNDALMRALVCSVGIIATFLSVLGWRNVQRNAELQIRLVKAGEMNTHLAEMNFAAAGLAHETRNPLNLIRGFAQMISHEANSLPKLRDHAAAIIEEADRVTVQLNEFINYSKPREVHRAPVDLFNLVADLVRTLQPDLEEKQLQVTWPQERARVLADSQLLRQALFNLLLNAVQAVGPAGRVEVRWRRTAEGQMALEVADDGPGVPAAERENIFKPYVTMRAKGVGLGLAIVKQIILAHRAEIICTENSPRGARFVISGLETAPEATP